MCVLRSHLLPLEVKSKGRHLNLNLEGVVRGEGRGRGGRAPTLARVCSLGEGKERGELEVGYRVCDPWVCLRFLAMGWGLCPWTLECVVWS